MTENVHTRARGMIRKGWVDELSAAENEWLQAHLRDCQECARAADSTRALVSGLRAAPVMADPALVEITRARVQRRAQELREATERSRMLVVACAASFISGGITLPLLWQLFAWLGGEISLAQTVWQAGFVLFVLLPGLLGGAVLLTRRRTSELIHLKGAGE
jgi:hypothetical protein